MTEVLTRRTKTEKEIETEQTRRQRQQSSVLLTMPELTSMAAETTSCLFLHSKSCPLIPWAHVNTACLASFSWAMASSNYRGTPSHLSFHFIFLIYTANVMSQQLQVSTEYT